MDRAAMTRQGQRGAVAARDSRAASLGATPRQDAPSRVLLGRPLQALTASWQLTASLLRQTARLWSRRLRPAELPSPAPDNSDAPKSLAEAHARSETDWNPLRDWRRAVRNGLITVGAFSVFVNLLMLTIPLYLFQLSDRVLTSHSLDTLLMLSLLAIAFIAVLALVDIFRRQLLGALANKFEAILGGPLLASVISSSHTGAGNVHAVRSLHHVRNFVSSPTMLLLFDTPMAPLYFAVVFLINVQLGFIALLSGLLLMAIAVVNQRATSDWLMRASSHNHRAEGHAEALARNSQVINAMGMMNESILLWGREQAQALTWQFSALTRNFWISGASKFVRLITQILVLGWGAYLALSSEITGGMMIAASIIASRALQPLEGMIEGWRSVVQTRAAYDRVIAAVDALQRVKARLQLPRPKGRLAVERLLYIPPGCKEPTVNGVSFSLEPGESLAVVGPSGSGKSTLVRLIVGCLVPTAGRIRLDGTELRHWDRRQYGQYVGYLPQEVELFPGTIRENICRMRNDMLDDEVYAAAVAAGVHEMITHMHDGYETVLEGSGAPLSGGQKQRVALARALFGGPSLIVLDEPNSNLDADGEQALNQSLVRAKERQITMVVVTQRPALLNSIDKVLILRSGRLDAFGAPDQVLRRVVRQQPPAEEAAEEHRESAAAP